MWCRQGEKSGSLEMVTAFVRYLPIFLCVLITNAKAGHKCKFQWMFRFFCVLFSVVCLYVQAASQGTKWTSFSRSHLPPKFTKVVIKSKKLEPFYFSNTKNDSKKKMHCTIMAIMGCSCYCYFWFQRQISWHQWHYHFVCSWTDVATEQQSAKKLLLVGILFSKASENFETSNSARVVHAVSTWSKSSRSLSTPLLIIN